MYTISNIYVLAAFGTIGGALFGFDVSSMSAWIDQEQYLEYFNHPNSNLQGGVSEHPYAIRNHPRLMIVQITASMSGGSFLGALAAGAICDSVGRRKSLMIASVIWIIGAAIQCSSQNVAQLIVGRLVSGLAVGITSSQVVSSAYASSISSKHDSDLNDSNKPILILESQCVYLAELSPAHIRGRVVGIQQWAIEWVMKTGDINCWDDH